MNFLIGLISVLLLTTIAPVFPQKARIFQGENATATQFPYLVHLKVYYPRTTKLCSGCLIGKEWILTAAHCIVSNSTYPLRISARLGSNKRSSGGIIVHGIEYAIHNEYDKRTMLNDIALVKIPPVDLNVNQYIKAIALPAINATQSYVNKIVLAVGWGALGNNKTKFSEFSQWTTFYVSSAKDCFKKLRRKMPTSHMCLQPTNASSLSSICSGDSGSPIVTDSDNNELIGVASYITNLGCEMGLPMFYTNVTYALSWINYYVKST